jgi:hypothetical protein
MDRSAETANNIATLETIQAMCRQEDSPAYRVVDYLAQIPSSAVLAVDAECRSAMMKWCYQVADACKYNRGETVSIAMSCLDRFLSSSKPGREILFDRNQFQLAAMTALYLAIKVHECRPMDSRLMSSLSHYSHSPKDIEAMECKILHGIQWRVNPPTAFSFVRNMVTLLPEYYYKMMDDAERETIVEMTALQLDIFSTSNHPLSWCWAPASWLAFASLLNAVESVVVSSDHYPNGSYISVSFGVKVGFANFEATMTKILKMDRDSLRQIRLALYEAINGSTTTSGCDDNDDGMEIQDCSSLDHSPCARKVDVATIAAAATTTTTMNHVYGTNDHVHGSPRFVRA